MDMIPAAERIREIMESRGMKTWTELAMEAGVSPSRISNFLWGRSDSPRTARKIREALGGEITLDELLERSLGSEGENPNAGDDARPTRR